MSVSTYCNWGLYDEDNSSCLEEGDFCDRFSYWDNGNRITLENVKINDIRKDEVTLELEDYDEVTVDVDDIIDWD